ncbi:hypothetical protein [Chryseobacterium mucoviscidosis]|uniref:hypothetical protein n=1 Tax=Chryseobacterium mucoviscidosis TaxID=1945581 RepID=UPI003018F252
MEKFLFKKETCYKINLPSENDIQEYLNNYANLNLFNSKSLIVDAFSIDTEKYGNLKLHEYINKYNLDKSLLYFYEEMKDFTLSKLSVKQKMLLSITENLENDCLLISLEALSERTRLYLIFVSYFLINYKRKNTIILFEFSTLDNKYKNIEITEVKPSWKENLISRICNP